MERIIGEYKIVVDIDDDSESPRTTEDNLGTMVCFHSKYILGDKHCYNKGDYSLWSELKADIIKNEDALIILPLFFLDHSGQKISTSPFNDNWDSGRVGFIFVSKGKVREEYNVKRISSKLKTLVISVLETEVDAYNSYIQGSVFKFNVWKGEKLIDSCYNFYNEQECLEAAMECMK